MKHLLSIVIISTLLGCASFSKKEFRKEYVRLDVNNLTNINGVYSFYPQKLYGKDYVNRPPDSLKYMNLYQGLVKEDWITKKKFDSLRSNSNDYKLSLNLIKNSELQIKVLENEVTIKDTLINGKVKNGMFYLNNKNLEVYGIPFLLGNYYSDKRRIGLTKNNNLIVNEAIGNEGGILIILSAGFQHNSTYEYRRLR